jgi:predicted ATPase
VLIGPNAAGKSNFVSFFQLLEAIIQERLQTYVQTAGGPSSFTTRCSSAASSPRRLGWMRSVPCAPISTRG